MNLIKKIRGAYRRWYLKRNPPPVKPRGWVKMMKAQPIMKTRKEMIAMAKEYTERTGRKYTFKDIRAFLKKEHKRCEWFLNDRYQCTVERVNFAGLNMAHLSIKRRDQGVIHDWRDLQRIKNDVLGEECEACELYPAESRLFDSANQYHLWGFPDPEQRFPFGYTGRHVDYRDGESFTQRSIEPEAKP